MFGHNDDTNQTSGADASGAPPAVPPPVDSGAPIAATSAMPVPDQMVAPQNPIADPMASPLPDPLASAPPSDPVTSAADSLAVPATETPSEDNMINGVPADSSYAAPETPQISSNYDSKPGTNDLDGPIEDELIDIKKKALDSLAPLVDELDQTPEEKFKTTMMLIQASDNADLVKDAFAAANAIGDEKARAQALLDVVNEINYFTHSGGGEAPASAEPAV